MLPDTETMKNILAVCGLSLLCSGISSFAQSSSGSSGTVHGSVVDQTGAAIVGASVDIRNPVSGLVRSTLTDSQGKFRFDNLPYNPYHVTSAASNFQAAEQDVDVKSPIPIDIKFNLKIGEASTTIAVTAEGRDLIEVDPISHTDVDRGLFDKLPLESQSSSLSSLVTLSAPGTSADSNGLFHGFGDHASNSFSVDGQKITDQQSKVFSNQIPVDSVQSLEVIQGAPPAEYGDKTSLVIVVTTRSGLGVDKAHGEVTGSYGTFGTGGGGFNLSYGKNSWGNFISASGMNTGRFLDGPEFTVMHDHGNQGNVFDRVDIKPSQADTINVNLGFTRSWFQTPNSFDNQTASAWSGIVVDNGGLGPDGKIVGPQDQRSKINTLNIAPTWTHLVGPHTVFTLGGFVRRDQFNYYPSANPFSDLSGDLQSETVGQNRTLTNIGGHADLSYVNGIHNIKTGIQYDHTFLTEKDAFGIVDPTLNPPCLNADGSPFTGSSLTDPAGCTGELQPNPNFVAATRMHRPDADRNAARQQRVPQFHGRLVQLPRARRHQGTGPVLPGQHYRPQLVVQPWASRRLLQWPRLRQADRASSRHCLQHQEDQHGDARFLCQDSGNSVQ